MFEGIVLVIFYIIGGLAALLALFFLTISVIRRSKAMFKMGLIVAIIPLLLYAVIYWFYEIRVPNLNHQQEKAYAGIYVMSTSKGVQDKIKVSRQRPRLVLNGDNSFQLDKNEFISFFGGGTWKTGATEDGQFEFKDSKDSIVFWATPTNNNKLEIDKHFGDKQSIVFVKSTSDH